MSRYIYLDIFFFKYMNNEHIYIDVCKSIYIYKYIERVCHIGTNSLMFWRKGWQLVYVLQEVFLVSQLWQKKQKHSGDTCLSISKYILERWFLRFTNTSKETIPLAHLNKKFKFSKSQHGFSCVTWYFYIYGCRPAWGNAGCAAGFGSSNRSVVVVEKLVTG